MTEVRSLNRPRPQPSAVRWPSFAHLLTLTLMLLPTGCERAIIASGGNCSLNSDCTSPLICGFARCRRQCVDSRDCGAGLRCLNVGAMGGACQLPEEAVCSLTSQCSAGQVCRFGTCTTECGDDRDCPPGAMCQLDDESGANACVEPIAELCIYNSDCPAPLVCGQDQRCELECAEDRDCSSERRCINFLCELIDGG